MVGDDFAKYEGTDKKRQSQPPLGQGQEPHVPPRTGHQPSYELLSLHAILRLYGISYVLRRTTSSEVADVDFFPEG